MASKPKKPAAHPSAAIAPRTLSPGWSSPVTSYAWYRPRAATLLLHSDQPVTCIGQAVGWPDQNYFARRFKAHYGLSATTYRARFATSAVHLAPNRAGGLPFEIGSRPGDGGRSAAS